jgi:hypothetical protein
VRNASFIVVVLLVVFSGSAFAAACAPGQLIAGPATLTAGTQVLPNAGYSCTEGIYTFSNFVVTGNTVPTPVADFSVMTGSATSAATDTLDFGYSNITGTGADFLLTYTITPGVGFASLAVGGSTTVSEILCSVATVGGTCGGTELASLGVNTVPPSNVSSDTSTVTAAVTDYVSNDVTGGSDLTNDVAPEPVTFSLMGLGLLAIGFAGRKRLRKG